MKESDLQQSIADAINWTDKFFASIVDVNLIPHRGKDGETRMIRNRATLGVGDIYVQGPEQRGFWLEVKTGRASQNPNQLKWEALLVKMGGAYYLCRSVDAALRICCVQCDKWGFEDKSLMAIVEAVND